MLDLVASGCRSLLGVTFALAVIGKVRGRDGFEAFVAAVGVLVPRWLRWRRPIAFGIVVVEAAIPILLSAPEMVLPGAALATVVLLVFTTGITVAVRHGRTTSCRCFGASRAPLGPRHLVRNSLLLAAVGALTAATMAVGPRADPAGTVLAVCAGAIAAVFVALFDDIAELFWPSPPPRTLQKGSR